MFSFLCDEQVEIYLHFLGGFVVRILCWLLVVFFPLWGCEAQQVKEEQPQSVNSMSSIQEKTDDQLKGVSEKSESAASKSAKSENKKRSNKSSSASNQPDPCSGMTNGAAVSVSVSGFPQRFTAVVLDVEKGRAKVQILDPQSPSSQKGKKYTMDCSVVHVK